MRVAHSRVSARRARGALRSRVAAARRQAHRLGWDGLRQTTS
jgi:hypothetical protein